MFSGILRSSITIGAFISVVFLSLLWLLPSIAMGKSPCLDAIAWQGSPENIAIIREALSGGVLISQAPIRCKNMVINVVYEHGEWRIQVLRHGTSSTTRGKKIGPVATWIESLLVPPVAIVIPTSKKPPHSLTPVEKIKPPEKTGPKGPAKMARAPGLPLTLGLTAGIGVTENEAGAVGSAEINYLVLKWLSLGVSGGYFHVPQQQSLTYNLVFFDGQAALPMVFGRFSMSLGLSAGFEYTDMEKTGVEGFGTGIPTRVTTSKLRLGLFAGGAYFLTDHLQLTLRLSFRYTPLDGTIRDRSPGSTGGNSVPEYSSDFLRREFPLPPVAVFLQIGLAWNFGGMS
ncbi:hypothetical protein KKF84_09645 [Myxococcota bacterium]|nr:hypothetical protein [Myxococcota bacterium]MBU1535574.1 hypothetical protein [Myxococcota bacterium]